jgi:hypothetical protein
MSAALFALGVWLSMRLVAAVYRVIDLWYTIASRWLGVAVRIAVWGAATTAIALFLRGPHRTAFLAGLVSFLVFYPSLYALRDVAIRRPPS